jgi:two-component system OmpR family response regulator
MSEPEPKDGFRVLVVDPDPEERWNLTYILHCCGVRVTAAASGATALSLLARRAPDLIIASLVLPDVSGLRILGSAWNYWPPVRVVLSATWRSRALLDRVSRAGASDLIRHPVREREVRAVVARYRALRIQDEEPAP